MTLRRPIRFSGGPFPIVEQRHANNGLSSGSVSLLSDRYTIVRLKKTCGRVTVKIFSGFLDSRIGRLETIYTSAGPINYWNPFTGFVLREKRNFERVRDNKRKSVYDTITVEEWIKGFLTLREKKNLENCTKKEFRESVTHARWRTLFKDSSLTQHASDRGQRMPKTPRLSSWIPRAFSTGQSKQKRK